MFSCSSDLKQSSIDWQRWKLDKFACENYRLQTLNQLEENLQVIEEMTEYEILGTLGQPDASELLRRSQKEFNYFLEPGPECESPSTSPRMLWIRFGAIGNVSEALIISD